MANEMNQRNENRVSHNGEYVLQWRSAGGTPQDRQAEEEADSYTRPTRGGTVGEKKKEGGQQLDATENGNVMAALFGRGRMNR